MLARGALCRLAAEVPKQAVHELPKLATVVQTARSGFSLPVRTLAHVSQLQTRSYATTKAEKEPAAAVKKAVKAKAAAGKKVTKTATKKAAPKKSKKKAAAPKKAANKAAAPKKAVKKARKVVTDADKQKALIKELRKVALKEPVVRSKLAAIHVYISEKTLGGKGTLSEIASSFKTISSAEREKYNHLAAERNEARLAEYQAWVKSHTPDQIRLANNARTLLKRKLAGVFKTGISHTQHIEDDRQIKRPVTQFAFFFAERQASPDFAGIAVGERARLIAGEWKALSAGDKQRFDEQAAADKQRYARDVAAAAA